MENFQKTFEMVRKARREVKKKMFSYIAAGFGLVAGLAWNDAIKAAIEYFLPKNENTVFAKVFYALLVTLIVAVVLWYVEKSIAKDEAEEK